jgi:hypothetical protein
MAQGSSRGSLILWLLTALVFGPPWVVFRLMAGDFRWNAFFFGFLPPVLAFEALQGLGAELAQAVRLVALAPLVVYAIIGFTHMILFGGAGIARLAGEALRFDGGAGELASRFGRRFGSTIASAARWYAIWLVGAAVGFGLALAMQAIVSAAGIPSDVLPVALLSRAAVGLVAGGMARALLKL